MELEGQMNSLWDTAAHSPRRHRCFLQASNTLLVPVCQFASVSHSAGLEVKKKKKTVTRCNRVHSLQYPIHLSNLKGSRRRKVSLPRATRVLICYLDWGFHLVDAVFFGCRQSWIFFPVLLVSYWCCVDACRWCVREAALSDYRVEQHYGLTYHNELSQSARPTGRTLHQRTKEKIKECYDSITIWSQSLTGDKTQCDTCNASNYHRKHRWRQGTNATQQPEAEITEKVIRMWYSTAYQTEQWACFRTKAVRLSTNTCLTHTHLVRCLASCSGISALTPRHSCTWAHKHHENITLWLLPTVIRSSWSKSNSLSSRYQLPFGTWKAWTSSTQPIP